MPKPYPQEFRDDVVAVARTGTAPLKQIATDFGISDGCLSNWMKRADVEDGNRPGPAVADAAELRADAGETGRAGRDRAVRLGRRAARLGMTFAGAAVATVPLITLFLFLQRFFVRGLATSCLR